MPRRKTQITTYGPKNLAQEIFGDIQKKAPVQMKGGAWVKQQTGYIAQQKSPQGILGKRRENVAYAREQKAVKQVARETSQTVRQLLQSVFIKTSTMEQRQAAETARQKHIEKAKQREATRLKRQENVAGARTVRSIMGGMEEGVIPSSNVASVAINDVNNNLLYVEFKDGSIYRYDLTNYGGVQTALRVVWGDERCRTNDPTGRSVQTSQLIPIFLSGEKPIGFQGNPLGFGSFSVSF